jgi:hypothetical protein
MLQAESEDVRRPIHRAEIHPSCGMGCGPDESATADESIPSGDDDI